jgi:hypothetical protein
MGYFLSQLCIMFKGILTKGETIHRMYRNHNYFGDGSVHDTWRSLTIQTIWCSFFEKKVVLNFRFLLLLIILFFRGVTIHFFHKRYVSWYLICITIRITIRFIGNCNYSLKSMLVDMGAAMFFFYEIAFFFFCWSFY